MMIMLSSKRTTYRHVLVLTSLCPMCTAADDDNEQIALATSLSLFFDVALEAFEKPCF